MAGQVARCWGRRMDRFQGRSLPQPLLQQQCSCSTVKPTGAIPGKTMTLCCSPCTGVLIHPGQGKLQSTGKAQAITTAVHGLTGGLPLPVQWQAHHKPCDRPPCTVLTDDEEIKLERASVDGC